MSLRTWVGADCADWADHSDEDAAGLRKASSVASGEWYKLLLRGNPLNPRDPRLPNSEGQNGAYDLRRGSCIMRRYSASQAAGMLSRGEYGPGS